jgi:hypothetical protein
VAEAFRLGDAVGNKIWKDWSRAPFAVLLITSEHEFLIRHPRPSADFALMGFDELLKSNVYFRKRVFQKNLLASFPAASPLLFQTSIHPGSVQQVLIGRQQSVARLWPLAGRARLVEQALLTALLEPAARVALVGGEERGTWMLEHHMASPRSFAFAALLTREPTDAAGSVTFTPGPETDGVVPTLGEFAQAMAERRALHWQGAGGAWSLAWL